MGNLNLYLKPSKMDYFSDNINVDPFTAMFKFTDLSDKTRSHLTKVYGNVMMSALLCAVAMWINAHVVFSGFFMTILIVIGMTYLTYKICTPYASESEKMGYMWALAFSMGFMTGPAMHAIADFNPQIITTAVVITGVMFASFSAISIFSKRRSFLFLGSLITSLISCMILYNIISWLTGYGTTKESLGYLMLTLSIACMYIIYDTQNIIERCETHGLR